MFSAPLPSTDRAVATPLLQVEGLRIAVERPDGGWAEAVSGLELSVHRGRSLGLVGESGCGKSLSVLAILGVLPARGVHLLGGEVRLDGLDLLELEPKDMRAIRASRLGFVPQDPLAALNPVLPIGDPLSEAVRLRGLPPRPSRRGSTEVAHGLLREVGLSPALFGRYPHELSGGQRQRVLLAMALAGDPELLLLDEPTTALDASLRADLVALLRSLQERRALGILLVAHDLGVVSAACDDVAVIYAGQVVERGPTAELLARPAHPYTQGLLEALPAVARAHGLTRLRAIAGQVPRPGQWGPGCRFRERCPRAEPRCVREMPALAVPPGLTTRAVACHFPTVTA